jgi:hypothetical protein
MGFLKLFNCLEFDYDFAFNKDVHDILTHCISFIGHFDWSLTLCFEPFSFQFNQQSILIHFFKETRSENSIDFKYSTIYGVSNVVNIHKAPSLVSPKADCISLFGQACPPSLSLRRGGRVGRTKVCVSLRLINYSKIYS